MKGARLINGLSEKNVWVNGPSILGPKMAHLHNSGSAVRIFFKFCTMKGANRYMKIILIIFSQKIVIWGKWTILGPKMVHHKSGSALRILNFGQ